MPKLPPPEHTRWKKGQGSPNPGGRPKLPKELAKTPLLSSEAIKRTISKHFAATKEELEKIKGDSTSSALDLVIVSTILKAIDHGDIGRAEMLFCRLVGRVKDFVEVIPPQPVIIHRLEGGTVELGTKTIEAEEDHE